MNKPFYLPSAIFLAWMFNIGLLPVTITTALIRPKCPELCPSECPEPIDCSEVIQDECGCCPLCVRNMHETCGSIDGVCRPPLQCRRLTPDSDQGRCVGELQQFLKFFRIHLFAHRREGKKFFCLSSVRSIYGLVFSA
ncbi:hypothetical protein AB6A40_001816 [Gnathostoma spinigerum]|uniref:IGFBP N-terminal domain-containing protein n=1 Tax=Gnathostoma spinigerum TaxID=75299 RepID=A0ABD6EEK2_9BILA